MTIALDHLYTLQSLGTFAGASGVVFVVAKMLATLTPWPPAPMAALVSLIVAVAGAFQAGGPVTFPLVVIVLGNTALLFCAATGVNETIAVSIRPKTPPTLAWTRAWASSWFGERRSAA